MYRFYAFGVIALIATAAVLGTLVPGPGALFVGFLVVFAAVLAGLFWHACF